MDQQLLHNFSNKVKFDSSCGSKSTTDRTVRENCLFKDFDFQFPERKTPEANENDFISDFNEYQSTAASVVNTVFHSKSPVQLCDRFF